MFSYYTLLVSCYFRVKATTIYFVQSKIKEEKQEDRYWVKNTIFQYERLKEDENTYVHLGVDFSDRFIVNREFVDLNTVALQFVHDLKNAMSNY